MDVATFPVYAMLCGMSLELLIKAVLIMQKEDVKPVHDLSALARHAEIPLDQAERGLLDLLTHYVVWYARYPVPRRNTAENVRELGRLIDEHLFEKASFGGLTIMSRRTPGPLDWQQYNSFWSKIASKFWELYPSL